MGKDKSTPAFLSAALYLVCGDDDFLVKEAAKDVVSQLVPDDMRDMGLETIDCDCQNSEDACAAMRRCLESLETPGFFGGVKLTWLKDVSFFASTKRRPGDSEETRALVDELVSRIKAGRVEPDLPLLISTTSINRASALFKAMKANGEVRDFGSGQKSYELDRLAGAQLDSRLKELSFKMDAAARELFINRVGTDIRRIASELDKLYCYVGGDRAATVDDVRAIVCAGRESAAWDLQDAFGERDSAKFVANLRSLLSQGEAVIALSAMLDSRVRDLLLAREALDRGWVALGGRDVRWGAFPPEVEEWFADDPKSDVRKVNSWRYRRIVEQASKWRLNELRLARYRLVEMREQIVSSAIPQDFLLESTVLRCIGKKA